MEEKLNTALLQADLHWENPSANKALFEREIDQLSSEIDLIVLPEMFSTGFSMNAEHLAEPPEGETFKWMQQIAAAKNAAVTGSLITVENDDYFNRLYFVFPDGSYEKYDKKHTFTLAGEHKIYSPGKEKLIVTYKGWRICPLVCYDLRFPVWSRNTEDYDVLIYVANWPSARVLAWDTLLKARAIENMCYCIGVNRVGEDGNDHPYPGHSAVYDPLGKAISRNCTNEATIIEVTLERPHLRELRKKFRFLQDRDDFIVK